MTPEFGAASQLEKIAMLDAADVVAINKFERRGAEDALRDVARQLVRNREAFGAAWSQMPVFGTSAARFDDDGVTALYQHLRELLAAQGLPAVAGMLPAVQREDLHRPAGQRPAGPGRLPGPDRRDGPRLPRAAPVSWPPPPGPGSTWAPPGPAAPGTAEALDPLIAAAAGALGTETMALIDGWPATVARYRQETLGYDVRGRHLEVPLVRTSLSGTPIPRVALPPMARDGGRDADHAELVRYLRGENVPGEFPYTAGVFPLKRDTESPTRMFAGEGDPARTNRRFHLLSAGQPATRLSTAFDSVTLYGRDPDERPDIYGKVGTSGVSVATLDDMRTLFAGFDLCSPSTSVSMTINGPAPAILAMFLNAAIDQQLDAFAAEHARAATEAEAAEIRARTLGRVRGTVQADILKEDQGQNTCILSTEFALRCMADVQQWFVDHRVRNFYSASISGYHIAEAGANPISQLAFTLANGFTYVESYLARGMAVDAFAPNLSFFFSNGMDPEYTVLGRVARRIWAVALRDRYGAGERAAKLKYHVQTSGRCLHAQEMDFNDIRTTLQALCAIYDNANSLHTNAYDEAVTTPSEHSVRRAVAIQLIIDREWGLAGCENPLQGSFVVQELTDLVEEAVLAEFEQLSRRGGVLGAMETGYQRGRIQDESMLYEQRKHDGTLPIIGVNTFLDEHPDPAPRALALARGTEDEKQGQLLPAAAVPGPARRGGAGHAAPAAGGGGHGRRTCSRC